MRIGVLFSGGKDSCRTIHWCIEQGFDIGYLVTIIPERSDSWMYHVPNIHLTSLSAEAIGIPLITQHSSGIKEVEVKDLKVALSGLNIDAVACGGLFSNYQRKRVEQVCQDLKLQCIIPFWHTDPEQFMKDTIELGFHVIITGVYALGFNKSWLGRKIDLETLEELKKIRNKYMINLVFEGGEAETTVLDGPIFRKRIKIIESEVVWEGQGGHLNITQAKLIDKK
jgi:diphthine-ammonia ligase